MRTTLSVLIGCALIITLSAVNCNKHKHDPVIKIEGVLVTDALGNSAFWMGPQGPDWTVMNSLSQEEMNVFNFNTSHSLTNTTEATIQLAVQAYPNPMADMQSYISNVSDSVLLKLAVVDEHLNVLHTASAKSKGTIFLSLDFSDRARFPVGKLFRVYYSYSAAGKPNFKVGYGDIMICNRLTATGQTIVCE